MTTKGKFVKANVRAAAIGGLAATFVVAVSLAPMLGHDAKPVQYRPTAEVTPATLAPEPEPTAIVEPAIVERMPAVEVRVDKVEERVTNLEAKVDPPTTTTTYWQQEPPKVVTPADVPMRIETTTTTIPLP